MAEETGGNRSALEQRERDLEALQALYAHWERGDFDFADVAFRAAGIEPR